MGASVWTPGSRVAEIIDPTVPINILPGTVSAPGLDFQGDTNTGIFQSAPGYFDITINGVWALSIDPNGNVTTKLGKWISNEEVDVATASTVDLGAATSNVVRLTGTSNVSSFGTTYAGPIFCRAAGAFILSNTASLILPNTVAINVAAGDSWIAVPKATSGTNDGWVVVGYTRASGTPINVNSDLSNTLRTDVASATTIDLTVSSLEQIRNLNITGTTTITGFTVATASLYFIRFAGALTLTNSATLVTQTGGNRLTAAGDTCILRATAANTVEILCYNEVLVTAANASKTVRVNAGGTALETYTPATVVQPALILLDTATPTAAANLDDFLNTFTSTYDEILIIGEGVLPSADDALRMRVAVAGTVDAGSNYYEGASWGGGTITATATSVAITGTVTAAGKGCGFEIRIGNINATTGLKMLYERSEYQTNATPGFSNRIAISCYAAANAISGIRLFWSGGSNFSAVGTIRVYGFANT